MARTSVVEPPSHSPDPQPEQPAPTDPLDVIVVGAGFGGIGAAVQLHRAGFHRFAVLEKGEDAGGCWRENTYPGCACDVPSHLYSYSFAPNADWSRQFAPQAEIEHYAADVVDRFGVRDHFRFGVEVLGAAWDETAQVWRIDTSDGPMTSRVLISAAGPLHQPLIPDLPGLSDFPGPVFHSAEWDHGVDLRGKRVAVIGSGASAIQFVPEIAKEAGAVTVFQRTAPWLFARPDFAISAPLRWAHRHVPGLRRAHRLLIFSIAEVLGYTQRHPRLNGPVRATLEAHLRRQVPDPELRARLTPDYEPGCKRILFSSDWYPTLQRPNVDVVSAGVQEIRGNTVIGADGSEYEADVIVLGTGFHVTDPPIATAVRGKDGRTLAETWAGSPKAYLGTTVTGFPNLFLLVGPNSALGHSSIIFVIEQQLRYVVAALRHMRWNAIGELDLEPQVQADYLREVDRRLAGAVWATGGCGSWYLDATGRNAAIWPWSLPRMALKMRRFDIEHYRARRKVPTPAAR
ncbi:MAG: NAD(P)/FAD-dependent oxidoreductase [Solirubrobacteraceae bacterium]|nr:NAD(P)/FAD-dependent oxidoreductase [Solirubrobacteraceae bacterium]